MALTISSIAADIVGQHVRTQGLIAFDSSYPTGGESLVATNIGLSVIDDIVVKSKSGYVFEYDHTNKKVLAYIYGGGTPSGTISTPTFTGDALGTHVHAATGLTYTATDGSLIYNYVPGGGDIKGSATVDVGIAAGTLQTNGQLISNLEAADNTNVFTLALQPDVPRAVGIAFKNTNAGASTGNAVDVTIVGTFRGAAQSEIVSFTALELTSTAQNEVATKYGSEPFDSITSITPSAAQPANWQHAAGPGSKLGLPIDPDTNAEADILKLTKNAANLAITGLYDSTNKTVNFGVLADGDDVAVIYKIDFDGAAGTLGGSTAATGGGTPAGTISTPTFTGDAVAAGALTEVAAATDLSTLTGVRFEALGV